jgi:hypothetical protein
MTDELVEVTVARDIPHAYMIKGLLEEAGIQVHVGNENLQTAVGLVPPGYSTAPRIIVLESQAKQALQILKDLEDSKGRGPG